MEATINGMAYIALHATTTPNKYVVDGVMDNAKFKLEVNVILICSVKNKPP